MLALLKNQVQLCGNERHSISAVEKSPWNSDNFRCLLWILKAKVLAFLKNQIFNKLLNILSLEAVRTHFLSYLHAK